MHTAATIIVRSIMRSKDLVGSSMSVRIPECMSECQVISYSATDITVIISILIIIVITNTLDGEQVVGVDELVGCRISVQYRAVASNTLRSLSEWQ